MCDLAICSDPEFEVNLLQSKVMKFYIMQICIFDHLIYKLTNLRIKFRFYNELFELNPSKIFIKYFCHQPLFNS